LNLCGDSVFFPFADAALVFRGPTQREWLRPELHLDGLDLTTLPDDVAYLDHLEEISMRDNKLETLPDVFSQLTNLKVRGRQSFLVSK
jgi:hypothetical protein